MERESTKREMYIHGLVQHGENSAWNLDKPVTSRRVSCVGLCLKARKALGSADRKRRLKEVSSFSLDPDRPRTVIVGFTRTGSWRRMLGREERKSLASLSESAEACCEKLFEKIAKFSRIGHRRCQSYIRKTRLKEICSELLALDRI